MCLKIPKILFIKTAVLEKNEMSMLGESLCINIDIACHRRRCIVKN